MAAVITDPTNGSASSISTVDSVAKLVEKYYRTWVTGGNIVGRYSVFDKTPAEFGGQMEIVRYDPTESVTLVRNPVSLETPNYPTPKKRYFGDWTEKKYYVDVSEGRLRRVVGDADAFAQLVATIINANNEGELADANKGYENLFYRVYPAGSTPTADEKKTLIGIVDPNGGTHATEYGYIGAGITLDPTQSATDEERLEDLLFNIGNIADSFGFESADDVGAGNICRVGMDRIRVIMPSTLYRLMGVKYLSRVRQLQELGKFPEIIVTPDVSFTEALGDEETTDYERFPVVVADIDAIGRVIQERTVKSTWHDESWSQRYSVAVADMIYYCPLYKCTTILY